MKQATREWIAKADNDLLLARQSRDSAKPVFDGITFHAQQCVEKYLKAVLQEHGARYARAHDLADLASQCQPLVPQLDEFAADLRWLTTIASDIRYPGASATREDADRSMQIATDVCRIIRKSFGPDG